MKEIRTPELLNMATTYSGAFRAKNMTGVSDIIDELVRRLAVMSMLVKTDKGFKEGDI